MRDRAVVLELLRAGGFYFDGLWYEKPVSPERYYKRVHFPENECPVAVEISEKIINFPNYYTKSELVEAYRIAEEYSDERQ